MEINIWNWFNDGEGYTFTKHSKHGLWEFELLYYLNKDKDFLIDFSDWFEVVDG